MRPIIHGLTLFLAIYYAGCIDVNNSTNDAQKPVIDRLTANPESVPVGDTVTITVEARDLQGENLSYIWSVLTLDGGAFTGDVTGPVVKWIAPTTAKNCTIKVEVRNESNKSASRTKVITVTQSPEPVITFISPAPNAFIPSSNATVICSAKTNVLVDTLSCTLDGQTVKTVYATNNIQHTWDIAQENGEKIITMTAIRNYLGNVYVKTASITVSIEGTIGKRKK